MTGGELVAGTGHGPKPAILLVEDEVLIRLATAELLREEGYVVLEAVDAGEAMALLRSGHPLDLVITDVRMAGEMDGVALSYALKEARPNLPVALVSGDLPGDAPHAGDGFLRKPFSDQELFDVVKKLMDPEWQSQRTRPAAS